MNNVIEVEISSAEEVEISSYKKIIPMIKNAIREDESRNNFFFRLNIKVFEWWKWKEKLKLKIEKEFKDFDIVDTRISNCLRHHHIKITVLNIPPCEIKGSEIKDMVEIISFLKADEPLADDEHERESNFNLMTDSDEDLVPSDEFEEEIRNFLKDKKDIRIELKGFFCPEHKCHHIVLKKEKIVKREPSTSLNLILVDFKNTLH